MLYLTFVMLYNNKKILKRKEVLFMPKEKEEMQSVTIRIPKDLYSDYKQALLEEGKIVTYDVRKHMNEVVKNHKEGQKNA